MKRINGEWLSEEECFQKHGKLVFVGLRKLLPIARKIGVDPEDLISEGKIGLIQAYRKFDDSLGFKFSTYAARAVYGNAMRFIQDKSKTIKFSRKYWEVANRIRREDLIELPKMEIAERLGVSEKLVEGALASVTSVHSLNKNSFEDNDVATLEEFIGTQADFTGVIVHQFISGLKPREREIIELRLLGKGQVEISQEVGVTQTHVSRILKGIGKQYLAM
ncbi:sigma factor [Paucisalibacillus globulus]|uniref:sigma factor n=1 Tax=Paucisalibacillus globulus TaxID=351095 RepID=UPI000BB77D1F|nr:sigma factor [Paucisalibacillus globulus]